LRPASVVRLLLLIVIACDKRKAFAQATKQPSLIVRNMHRFTRTVILLESGVSSTLRRLDSIADVSEYWITRLRG
jgi:hypothetical protein